MKQRMRHASIKQGARDAALPEGVVSTQLETDPVASGADVPARQARHSVPAVNTEGGRGRAQQGAGEMSRAVAVEQDTERLSGGAAQHMREHRADLRCPREGDLAGEEVGAVQGVGADGAAVGRARVDEMSRVRGARSQGQGRYGEGGGKSLLQHDAPFQGR